MSNSFKKVVACLLAVLMVMFSVPMTALAAADTTEYTPDIQLQFGAFANIETNAGDPDKWVSNYAGGKQRYQKRGANYDLSVSGLSSVQLAPTATLDKTNAIYKVSGLKVEASDTANLVDEYGDDWWGAEALASDYSLKAGDAFTVTVRMDGVSKVSFATAEVSYSDNIVPLYYAKGGSGNGAYYEIGTEEQGVSGNEILEGSTSDDLYTDNNGTVTCDGSAIITDYDGENYMYAAVGTAGKTLDWSAVTNAEAPDLVNEDGTLGNTYAGESVMTTFCFVLTEDISADNPIQFWVHNGGTDAHKKSTTGASVFSDFAEGCYSPTSDNDSKSTQTTYALNKFESAQNQFDGTENFGSKKMTFMGVNQNVQGSEPACEHTKTTTTYENVVPSTCTVAGSRDVVVTCDDCGEEISRTHEDLPLADHAYGSVVTAPTCTEGGYTTYTCSNCGDSYTADYTNPTGHSLTKTNEVPATCTEAGTEAYWTCGTCNKMFSDENATTEITEPVAIPATGHQWNPVSVNWNSLDTETKYVGVNYVCAHDSDHTVSAPRQATSEVIQNQTEDDPEITRFTYTEGEFSDYKDVQTKAAAGHTTHTYTVPVSLDWVGDTTQAKATFKCSKCDETVQYDATVTSVTKTPATCTAAKVVTYTAHYDGFTDISKDVTEGEALGHNLSKTDAVPASCTVAGTEAYWTCSRCNKLFSDEAGTNEISAPVEIPAKGHTPREAVKENEVAATKTTDGSYDLVVRCDVCETVISTEHVVVPAEGIAITVPKYDVGMVTLNNEELDGTKVNTTKVAYGSDYTLAVTDGKDYFKGWEVNGKINSTELTFTATAFADITVTPVFEVPNSNTITVVFFDNFGNEVKAYKDMDVDAYQNAIAADGIPTPQSYPSSRFVEWDTPDNEILGLTESKTIFAIYEDVESTKKFTVTVKNGTDDDITADALTIPGGIVNGEIPYDTMVTVSDTSAKGWDINGVTVSTESTYSFFVGADVTITKLDDAQAEPTVAIVGANRLDDPAYRYNIVATRNVPAGYELVAYGFVYGKNLTDADLNIDNEGKPGTGTNSGNVKVAYGNLQNSATEFALNYGVKTPNNKVCAKAFIVVKSAAGELQPVIYSTMTELDS